MSNQWLEMSVEQLESHHEYDKDARLGAYNDLIEALITIKGQLAGSNAIREAQEIELAEFKTGTATSAGVDKYLKSKDKN